MLAWLDGQLLESPEQPAIGVLDHGIIVGDGVFETIKIEDGVLVLRVDLRPPDAKG